LKDFNCNSINKTIENYKIESKNFLVIADMHIPYHNSKAVEIAIEYGLSKGIDTIYLNGDIIDCARISRWNLDHKMLNFEQVRDLFWSFNDYLDQFKVKKIFKVGNHEDRIENYMKSKAPELAMMSEFTIDKILKLNELSYDLVKSRQLAKAGNLLIIHGHEFGESIFSPVNPARGLFLKAKSNALAAHNHQTSEHHENTLNNESVSCFSMGCLCSLTPDYRPFAFTKWNLGFACVEVYEDGSFIVDNRRITDNKVR
jgi:predicted phosphodiesterase